MSLDSKHAYDVDEVNEVHGDVEIGVYRYLALGYLYLCPKVC